MSETNTRQPARPRWLTAERKRTEWRMRGIEPNNKRNVVFPSSVLPSRRFGNPPSPEGEGLIGCVFILSVSNAVVAISRINQTNTLSFRALVEKSPTIEMKTSEHEYPQTLASAGSAPRGGSPAEKSPALETETSKHDNPGLSSAASRHTAWVGQEDSPHIFICSGLRAWRFAGMAVCGHGSLRAIARRRANF